MHTWAAEAQPGPPGLQSFQDGSLSSRSTWSTELPGQAGSLSQNKNKSDVVVLIVNGKQRQTDQRQPALYSYRPARAMRAMC